MRQAFTLIVVCFLILMVLLGIIVPTFMAVRNHKNKNSIPDPNPKIDVQIGNVKYKSQKFILDGHSYFFINHPEAHGFTAVHDPECPKCKAALVKDVPVEVEKK